MPPKPSTPTGRTLTNAPRATTTATSVPDVPVALKLENGSKCASLPIPALHGRLSLPVGATRFPPAVLTMMPRVPVPQPSAETPRRPCSTATTTTIATTNSGSHTRLSHTSSRRISCTGVGFGDAGKRVGPSDSGDSDSPGISPPAAAATALGVSLMLLTSPPISRPLTPLKHRGRPSGSTTMDPCPPATPATVAALTILARRGRPSVRLHPLVGTEPVGNPSVTMIATKTTPAAVQGRELKSNSNRSSGFLPQTAVVVATARADLTVPQHCEYGSSLTAGSSFSAGSTLALNRAHGAVVSVYLGRDSHEAHRQHRKSGVHDEAEKHPDTSTDHCYSHALPRHNLLAPPPPAGATVRDITGMVAGESRGRCGGGASNRGRVMNTTTPPPVTTRAARGESAEGASEPALLTQVRGVMPDVLASLLPPSLSLASFAEQESSMWERRSLWHGKALPPPSPSPPSSPPRASLSLFRTAVHSDAIGPAVSTASSKRSPTITECCSPPPQTSSVNATAEEGCSVLGSDSQLALSRKLAQARNEGPRLLSATAATPFLPARVMWAATTDVQNGATAASLPFVEPSSPPPSLPRSSCCRLPRKKGMFESPPSHIESPATSVPSNLPAKAQTYPSPPSHTTAAASSTGDRATTTTASEGTDPELASLDRSESAPFTSPPRTQQCQMAIASDVDSSLPFITLLAVEESDVGEVEEEGATVIGADSRGESAEDSKEGGGSWPTSITAATMLTGPSATSALSRRLSGQPRVSADATTTASSAAVAAAASDVLYTPSSLQLQRFRALSSTHQQLRQGQRLPTSASVSLTTPLEDAQVQDWQSRVAVSLATLASLASVAGGAAAPQGVRSASSDRGSFISLCWGSRVAQSPLPASSSTPHGDHAAQQKKKSDTGKRREGKLKNRHTKQLRKVATTGKGRTVNEVEEKEEWLVSYARRYYGRLAQVCEHSADCFSSRDNFISLREHAAPLPMAAFAERPCDDLPLLCTGGGATQTAVLPSLARLGDGRGTEEAITDKDAEAHHAWNLSQRLLAVFRSVSDQTPLATASARSASLSLVCPSVTPQVPLRTNPTGTAVTVDSDARLKAVADAADGAALHSSVEEGGEDCPSSTLNAIAEQTARAPEEESPLFGEWKAPLADAGRGYTETHHNRKWLSQHIAPTDAPQPGSARAQRKRRQSLMLASSTDGATWMKEAARLSTSPHRYLDESYISPSSSRRRELREHSERVSTLKSGCHLEEMLSGSHGSAAAADSWHTLDAY